MNHLINKVMGSNVTHYILASQSQCHKQRYNQPMDTEAKRGRGNRESEMNY